MRNRITSLNANYVKKTPVSFAGASKSESTRDGTAGTNERFFDKHDFDKSVGAVSM